MLWPGDHNFQGNNMAGEREKPSQELFRCLLRPWFQKYLWKKDLHRHECYFYVAFCFFVLWYVRCCHFIWQLHGFILGNRVSGHWEDWELPGAGRCCPGDGRARPGSQACSSPDREQERWGTALGTSLGTGMGWGQAGNRSHGEKHIGGGGKGLRVQSPYRHHWADVWSNLKGLYLVKLYEV